MSNGSKGPIGSKGRVLIIGDISEMGMEVLETAIAAGYDPVVVVVEGQVGSAEHETLRLEQLPANYLSLPAILARSQIDKSLDHQRIDRRLYTRVSRHRDLAASHGITNWISLVHPTASVSPSARLGAGVFIGPLVAVSSRTTIGDFSRIGRGSSIGHDVKIGSFCRIAPGVAVSGNVQIGDQSMVGTGAVFIERVQIGERTLIGAGSVVTKDFPADSMAWGNPATLRS